MVVLVSAAAVVAMTEDARIANTGRRIWWVLLVAIGWFDVMRETQIVTDLEAHSGLYFATNGIDRVLLLGQVVCSYRGCRS